MSQKVARCLWFLSFGHSTRVCFFRVRVIEAAVNREELVLHTLEDFHVPSFEFGDRSPFGKYIYILCTRSIGQERKLCADLHSRVFLFSSFPSAPV